MKRAGFLILLAALLAAPAMAQPWANPRPFNVYQFPLGAQDEECEHAAYPGAYLILEDETGPLREIWYCPESTGIWTVFVLESEAVAQSHAEKHMTGGTNADPIGVYLQGWSAPHTFAPDAATTFGTSRGTVTLKGAEYDPLDDPDLQLWIVASEVPGSCGDGAGGGVEITSAFTDETGTRTVTPSGDTNEWPEKVCGNCCQGADWCDTNYLTDTVCDPADCDAFVNAPIAVHLESEASGHDEKFTISPTITWDETDAGFTVVWLGMGNAAPNQPTGALISVPAGPYLEGWENWRGVGSLFEYDTIGCAVSHTGNQLKGDDCGNCGASEACSDNELGEGPGDFAVQSFVFSIANPNSITLELARVNGASRLTATETCNQSGAGTFGATDVLDGWGKTAELLLYTGAKTADQVALVENYLSWKYTLGAGADWGGGAMNPEDRAAYTVPLLVEALTSGDSTLIDPDGRLKIQKSRTATNAEQLWIGYDESNFCTMTVGATGVLDLVCTGGFTVDGLAAATWVNQASEPTCTPGVFWIQDPGAGIGERIHVCLEASDDSTLKWVPLVEAR